MNVDPHALPPDVREALQRGDVIEAIKRLRHARGVSLKSAKSVIDAVREQVQAQQTARHNSSASTPQSLYQPGLAPGEVPHKSDSSWGWVLLILAVLALYFALR